MMLVINDTLRIMVTTLHLLQQMQPDYGKTKQQIQGYNSILQTKQQGINCFKRFHSLKLLSKINAYKCYDWLSDNVALNEITFQWCPSCINSSTGYLGLKMSGVLKLLLSLHLFRFLYFTSKEKLPLYLLGLKLIHFFHLPKHVSLKYNIDISP